MSIIVNIILLCVLLACLTMRYTSFRDFKLVGDNSYLVRGVKLVVNIEHRTSTKSMAGRRNQKDKINTVSNHQQFLNDCQTFGKYIKTMRATLVYPTPTVVSSFCTSYHTTH